MQSSREREHRDWLMSQDEDGQSNVRPAPASVGAVVGANTSVRTKQLLAEAAELDAASPSTRKKNAQSALIDFYANHYEQQKANERAEVQRKAAAAQKKLDDVKAEQKRAQIASDQLVARMNRAEILGILANDLDLLDEVTALAKSRGFLGNPIWYEGLLAEVKQRRK